MIEYGDEPAATAAEAAEARRLAEALDGRTCDAEPGALQVVYLLEASADDAATDELARHRLLRELTAAAARRGGRLALRRVAAAAAVLLVAAAGMTLLRHTGASSASVLAAREAAARTAVGGVTTAWDADTATRAYVTDSLDSEWRRRLDSELRSNRFATLASRTGEGETATWTLPVARPTHGAPTPGGVS